MFSNTEHSSASDLQTKFKTLELCPALHTSNTSGWTINESRDDSLSAEKLGNESLDFCRAALS
jgi:hypothetical protein